MAIKENFGKAASAMFAADSAQDFGQLAPVKSAVPQRGRATYLAPGSYMEGTLRVEGDVEVAGEFKGELIASGEAVIHSNICSNVSAARLTLSSCKLSGDVHVSNGVLIDETSSLEGNLYAGSLVCAGKIKGDIELSGNLTLQSTSRVDGSVTTGTMAMERGAMVGGALHMKGSSLAADKIPAEKTPTPADGQK